MGGRDLEESLVLGILTLQGRGSKGILRRILRGIRIWRERERETERGDGYYYYLLKLFINRVLGFELSTSSATQMGWR